MLVLLASRALAFCGFYVAGSDASLYNDATMVVLMRDGDRTVVSMQNTYAGPPEDFAMVVPVPVVLQEEQVRTLPHDVFAKLDRLAAPRLVEYWEQDPCARPTLSGADGAVDLSLLGSVGGGAAGEPGEVRVEARFEVGEYDVVILSATEAAALERWLRTNAYRIPAGAEPLLRPYVAAGQSFFVAKVDVDRVSFQDGRAELSPLRFHYDSTTFSLPIRLGLVNAREAQDLVVHVLGRTRYEVANRPNVFVPTNLDVTDATRDRFPEFYAALFDDTLARNPGAVVTEYAWSPASCDPCPGPTLDPQDLATLGGDAEEGPSTQRWGMLPTTLPERSADLVRLTVSRYLGQLTYCVERQARIGRLAAGRARMDVTIEGGTVTSVTPTDGGVDAALVACAAGKIRRWQFPEDAAGPLRLELTVDQPESKTPIGRRGPGRSYVLTRLHLRYSADDAGEDLVFREAPPVSGGREHDTGVVAAGTDTFQGRYVIRHAWTGPIACEEPRRGVWGGPPGGQAPEVRPAQDTAFAPRGAISLAAFLKAPLPAPSAQVPAEGSPAEEPPLLADPAPPPPAPPGRAWCATAEGAGAAPWGLLVGLLSRRRRATTARASG